MLSPSELLSAGFLVGSFESLLCFFLEVKVGGTLGNIVKLRKVPSFMLKVIYLPEGKR